MEDAGLEKVVARIPSSHTVGLHAQGSEELDRELQRAVAESEGDSL